MADDGCWQNRNALDPKRQKGAGWISTPQVGKAIGSTWGNSGERATNPSLPKCDAPTDGMRHQRGAPGRIRRHSLLHENRRAKTKGLESESTRLVGIIPCPLASSSELIQLPLPRIKPSSSPKAKKKRRAGSPVPSSVIAPARY